LVQTFNEDEDLVDMAEQMISKMQLIAKMHGEIIGNVSQAQARQKCAYASRKGKQMF
jgi:hypothetical protein